MSFYLKDPDALVDHAIDWSSYLGDRTIVASAWSVDPDEEGGVAIAETSFDTGRAAARAEGGIAGHVYRLTNRVTLSDGSEDERSLVLRVEQR
jgi:hypothetical protein